MTVHNYQTDKPFKLPFKDSTTCLPIEHRAYLFAPCSM